MASSPRRMASAIAAMPIQNVYYIGYPLVLAVGLGVTWVNTRRQEAMKGDMAHVNEQLREFYGPLQSIAAATYASYEAMIQQFLERRAREYPNDTESVEKEIVVSNETAQASEDDKTATEAEAPWLGRLGAFVSTLADPPSTAASSSSPPPEKSASTPSSQQPQSAVSSKLSTALKTLRARKDRQKREWHAALTAPSLPGVASPAAQHYRLWAIEVLQPLNEKALEILIRRADLMETTTVPVVFRQFAAHCLAFRTTLAQWKAGEFSQTHCGVRYPEGFGAFVSEEFRRLKLRQAAQLNTQRTLRRGGTILPWAGFGFVEMKDPTGQSQQPMNDRWEDHPANPPQSSPMDPELKSVDLHWGDLADYITGSERRSKL